MKSIDAVLNLSRNFGVPASDPGFIMVELIFSIVWQLLDASLDDECLLELTPERKSRWPIKPLEMEIDGCDGYDEQRVQDNERLRNMNTLMAIEIIAQFLQNNVTSRIIFLARRNLYVFFNLLYLLCNLMHSTLKS